MWGTNVSEPVNRDLRLLAAEIGQAFAQRRQLPELIAFAVATFRELLKAEGVAILLLDADSDELYFPYLAEEDPRVAAQLSRIRFAAHQGIAGKVLRTGRSLRIDDVSTDPGFFAGVDQKTQRTTRSLVCAPLISSHGAIGVIEALNPRSGGRFTDDDLALLDGLAGTVAGAIENMRQRTGAAAGEESAGHHSSATGDEQQTPRDHVFRRHGEYWTIAYDGETFRLRHAKGLAYIAQLLRHPGQELHAIDLINAAEDDPDAPRRGHLGKTEPQQRSLGDAGEVLDAHAKADYKRRLTDLREELAEAQAVNDSGRVEHVQQEMDVLTQELARAVGLGGRERRVGSHAERARVNITRAIASALQRIAEHHPALGRHFTATIKTGTFCSYAPDPRMPLEWVL